MKRRMINQWNERVPLSQESEGEIIKDLMETAKNVGKPGKLVQMPLRCSSMLEEKIIRALGSVMTKSGKKTSKNDFVLKLIELGLRQIDKEL